MRFSPTFLDEIRDRVPISSVIGARVSWDRRKTNAGKGDWWACCPFHGEKSPSFHCEDRKGRYHCFGCGVSGDHFRFLTDLEGLSFPEAVERVADLAGVPMPVRDVQEERRDRERATLHDVMELATTFFEEKLQSAEGAKARAYLRERGLSSGTQHSFRLGYAPDSRNALKEYLAGKGVEKAQMEACGLTVFEDVPVSYDRFRDRIMFPIPDSRGRMIAFGGRALSSDALAKYLNSPETELFHKGNVLFNFARARKAMQKAGTVIAVEGYMDVIALAQAGFENVVAPLGTALTENQLELLWRMTGEPVLCFDGDKAGLKAAWRAADLALPVVQPGRTVRFALLPEGKDPDDLVRDSGAEAFTNVLKDSRPLVDLLWNRETAGGNFETPERRADLEKTLRELTSRIKDESLRFHYAQEMRDRVLAFFGSTRPNAQRQKQWQKNEQAGGQFSRPGTGKIAASERLTRSAMIKRERDAMTVREATLVVAIVNHPQLVDEFFEYVEFLDLASEDLRKLHAVLLDALAHNAHADRAAVLKSVEQAGTSEIWDRAIALVRRTRDWTALADAAIEDARDAFTQTLRLHVSSRTLHRELKAAELAMNSEPSEENFRNFLEIQEQMREAQNAEALIDGFGVSSGRVRAG